VPAAHARAGRRYTSARAGIHPRLPRPAGRRWSALAEGGGDNGVDSASFGVCVRHDRAQSADANCKEELGDLHVRGGAVCAAALGAASVVGRALLGVRESVRGVAHTSVLRPRPDRP
jgi:hypothetical protein